MSALRDEVGPGPNNILNSNWHDEILIEIFTYLSLGVAKEVAAVSKRFSRVANDDSWKPKFLLYTWGCPKTSGKGESVLRPQLLQIFFTPQTRRQVLMTACTNFASFCLTHGGNLYWWGEMKVGDTMVVSESPRVLEACEEYDILAFDATCSGYFHNRQKYVSLSFKDRKGGFFQWGSNIYGQLFIPSKENDLDVEDVRRQIFADFQDYLNYLITNQRSHTIIGSVEELFSSFHDNHELTKALARQKFVRKPVRIDCFGKQEQKVTHFSSGVSVSAVATIDADMLTHVYQAHSGIMEVEELRGVTVKQLVCGGWFCLLLDTAGSIWSWGQQYGPDISNGHLLGRDIGDSHSTVHAAKIIWQPGVAAACKTIFITASTYNALAILADGSVYTWGDSDGWSLGHSVQACNTPAPIEANITGRDACLSYTCGTVCTLEGDMYMWGGGHVDNRARPSRRYRGRGRNSQRVFPSAMGQQRSGVPK